jgi:chaperonin cofactor prefoldin
MSDIQRLEAQIQQMQRTIEAMCTRIIKLEARIQLLKDILLRGADEIDFDTV